MGPLFFVYVGRQSGAELLWAAQDGGPPTPELAKARQFTAEEAREATSDPATYDVAYPCDEVWARSRATVSQLPDPSYRFSGRAV